MKRNSSGFIATALLLALALALGGAGQNFPLLEMFLDLGALVTAAKLISSPHPEGLTTLSRWALALATSIVLLPAFQLVPLPPTTWQSLPGRALPFQIDTILGLRMWRPVSLDVETTVRALLSLIPAWVMFFACLHLHTSERAKLLVVVVIFAVVSATLGIAQLATGGSMTPYPSAHVGYPIGLFVNRNHQAVLLLLSIPIVGALVVRRPRSVRSKLPYIVGTFAIETVLAVVTVGTTSRLALALLPLALGGALALLLFRQSIWRVAFPSTLALAVLATALYWMGGFNRNLARFSSLQDSRFDYWDDVSWALHHYGLSGTGFGTFVSVYQTAESLSSVSPSILNHAHNDFIELALEGGIPAVLLLLLFFMIVALAAARLVCRRLDFNRGALSLSAAVGLVIILSFSLVDYPLRMPAISCTFAALVACILPTPVPILASSELIAAPSGNGRKRLLRRSYAQRTIAVAFLGILSVVVVQSGVSAEANLANDYDTARRWAPWSTAAHEGLANDLLAGRHPREAMSQALSALRLSPIDAIAVRTAAASLALQGSERKSQRLMQVGVTLGWRDPFTQLWAIDASSRTKEPQKAVQRAQALFQQNLFLTPALVVLLEDSPNGPVARTFLQALEAPPPWRAQFIQATGQLPPQYMNRLVLLLSQLDHGHSPLSIDEARPLIQHLLAINDIENARRLWLEVHRRSYIANGGFEEVSSRDGAAVPSDWDVADEDLATIAIQAPNFRGHALALRISAAARPGPILSQQLMLAPGSFDITYRARSGSGQHVSILWQLHCSPSDFIETRQAAPASSTGWQKFRGKFTVPIQDCPIQRLALERSNDTGMTEVWVDDVSVKPAVR